MFVSIYDANMDMYWGQFHGRTNWPQMNEEKAEGAQLIDVSCRAVCGQPSCAPWLALLPAVGVSPGGKKYSFRSSIVLKIF